LRFVPSDDVPTVRPSGTIAVFEQTLVEAIARLEGLPEAEELRRDAGALLALFRSWKVRAPNPEERAAAISRLMDVHRASEELASKR
jgi:hypothetical protein